jgi:hypothetical protein
MRRRVLPGWCGQRAAEGRKLERGMGGCWLKVNADFAQQEYPHFKLDRSGRIVLEFLKR